MEEKYFVASNSSRGFCSYYDGVFDPQKLSRIYVIKGGSGTGKATFMREAAKAAEARGFGVTYIYCSSDAESLDGIIVNEPRIAILDGTFPHVYEPRMLGACETLVDLGAFLDERLLKNSRGIIEELIREKEACFARAYAALGAYEDASAYIERLVLPSVKLEKMQKYAKKFADAMEEETGEVENLLVRSIGMRGLSSFDTYYERAGIYYEVNDFFDVAHIFMNEIYSAFLHKRINMRVSNNPILVRRIDALCARTGGLTFEISNGMVDGSRTVNMRRFVNADGVALVRADYRAAARVRDGALNIAVSEFEKVKKKHFLIENVYGAAMDFEAKEKFTAEFCNKIFENN